MAESNDRPIALVTGASRGIGRCAALALARRGHDLVLAARTVREGDGRVPPGSRLSGEEVAVPGSLETTAAEVEALGARAKTVVLDLDDRASVRAAATDALEAFGRVDVLVTNAIVQGYGVMERVADLAIDDVDRITTGIYVHQLLLVTALVPPMAERGSGVFVHVTSGSAQADPPFPVGEGGWGLAYAAAKAAAHRIPGHVHAEFGRRGVRAYNLDPGAVLTEAMKVRGSSVGAVWTDPSIPGEVIGWLAAGDVDPGLAGGVVHAAQWHERATA